MTSWPPTYPTDDANGQGMGPAGPVLSACHWHPDRITGLSCSRCGLSACPDCLQDASVGFHCRSCVAQARASYQPARTVSGAHWGTQPLVTWILLGLNVAAFVVGAAQAGSLQTMFRSTLWLDGALIPGSVAADQWWRLITSGFLHLGLVHVAVNMLTLYFLGPPLERVLGRVRFLAVYLLSLIGGSTAVMLFSDSITVGASGALFGILGALLVTFRRLRADYRQLVVVLVINLVMTFTIPGISWQGHLGGLVVGVLAGVAMVYAPPGRRTVVQTSACALILAVCVGLIIWRMTTIPPSICFYGPGSSGPGVYCARG